MSHWAVGMLKIIVLQRTAPFGRGSEWGTSGIPSRDQRERSRLILREITAHRGIVILRFRAQHLDLVQDAGKLLVPFRAEVEHEYAALMIEGQFNVTDESLVHAKFTQAPLEFTAFVARQIAIGQLFERIHYLLRAKFMLVKNDHPRSGGLRRLDKQLVVRVFIAVPVNRGRG